LKIKWDEKRIIENKADVNKIQTPSERSRDDASLRGVAVSRD